MKDCWHALNSKIDTMKFALYVNAPSWRKKWKITGMRWYCQEHCRRVDRSNQLGEEKNLLYLMIKMLTKDGVWVQPKLIISTWCW